MRLVTARGRPAWPAGNYARGSSPNDCTAPIQAPVELALVGFASAAQAKATIGNETGWSSQDPGGQRLSMKDGPASGDPMQCLGETNGRLSPTSGDGQRRAYMRLWNNATSAVVAGAPVRQRKTTTECGATSANPKWITASDGFVKGLQDFELDFPVQGHLGSGGPYPIEGVMWGNSASIQQCNGTSVSSSGWVDIVRPKDDFGFQASFGANQDDLMRKQLPPNQQGTHQLANCGQMPDHVPPIKDSVIDQLQGAGVTTIRFGITWQSVAPCSGASRSEWEWERWQKTVPQLASAGIKPIIVVSGAPDAKPGDPQWVKPGCDQGVSPVVNTTAGSGGLAGWRNFVEDVATKYGGQARAIEVWNEENTKPYWGNCAPDPADYARILQIAEQGVAASTHPNIKTLLGAPVSNVVATRGDIGWRDFLSNVFSDLPPESEADLDAIGFHPYRTSEDAAREIPPADSARNQIEAVRGRLDELNVDQPIWVTEDGTTTAGPTNNPNYVGNNELLQGLYDHDIYFTLRNMGIPAVVIHSYVDTGGSGPSSGFGVLGQPANPLLDAPFPVKSAYCLLAQQRGLGASGSCNSG